MPNLRASRVSSFVRPSKPSKQSKSEPSTSVFNDLFASESASAGHPDKLYDRISDTVLDAFLQRDRNARVAYETFAANDKIIVAGEFRTFLDEDFHAVRAAASSVVRETLGQIGYGTAQYDIDPDACEIEIRFNHQSPEIQAEVDGSQTIGAGDQGMMFRHAVDETESLMPLTWSLVADLIKRATALVVPAGIVKPYGKAQVTVRYADGEAVGIDTVVLSWQHSPEACFQLGKLSIALRCAQFTEE